MAALVLTSVTKITTSNSVDLTAVGADNWAHWGNSSVTPAQTKNGGSGTISAALYGGGSANTYSGDLRTTSWTDGTPSASGSDTKGSYNNGGVNSGYEIQFDADTTERVATIYMGYYQCTAKITAIISDASTGNQVDSTTLTGTASTAYDGVIVVTYSAASSGQNMKLRMEAPAGIGSPPNVSLGAATVKITGTAGGGLFKQNPMSGLYAGGPFFCGVA